MSLELNEDDIKHVSTYKVALIKAEEDYLKMCGWKLIERQRLASRWTNPRYTISYSRNHAILIENNKWMVIQTDARYINHSCDPNCIIDNDLRLITVRPVNEGEELTINYHIVYEGEDPGFWDPRWSFKCCCGAKNCQGIIDKYITIDGKPWYPGIYEIRKKAYIVEKSEMVVNTV